MTEQLSLDAETNLDARIEDVLMGRSGPWPLPSRHHELLRLMLAHKGAERAWPISAISVRLDLQPRDIKAAVKSLVEDFGIPIGASGKSLTDIFFALPRST